MWNLALCVLNLLPLPSTDGLRILRTVSRPVKVRAVVPRLQAGQSAMLVRLR